MLFTKQPCAQLSRICWRPSRPPSTGRSIPEQTLANGKRPDGTLRDSFNLPRGYWEAKDTKDDLHVEIRKKIAIGYPITNTIFEDTRRAILYQNSKLALEIDLTQPKELTDCCLTLFSLYRARYRHL